MLYLFNGEGGASTVYDASSLTQELIDYAVKVNELPQPEIREGFYSQLFCNHETAEVWYEYFPIPVEEPVEEPLPEPLPEESIQ